MGWSMNWVHGPGPWGGPWTRSIGWSMEPGPCFIYVHNNLSVVAIISNSTRTATDIYYSYGSQKFSLNFLVIADSSLSKLLYLPEEKLSDSSECRFFEPD